MHLTRRVRRAWLRKHYWLSISAPAVTAALLLVAGDAAADEIFSARSQISLPMGQSVTSFDISFVDPVIGVYLLSDRTNKAVDLIDTTSNDVLVQLSATPPFAGVVSPCAGGTNNCNGPNGVITVNHREVWAGDYPSVVKVIDLFSQKTTPIPTGGSFRADELCFDPRDQLVMIANDAEVPYPFISIISTSSYSVRQKITMDGTVPLGSTIAAPKATNGIEQCQWDRHTGKFYQNIPEANGPGDDTTPGAVVVYKVTSQGTVVIDAVWSVPHDKCAGPQGMAIGPDHQILLGCNAPSGKTETSPNGNGNFSTVIIDDRDGSIIATLNNQNGADEVWFNDGDDHYFLAQESAGTGTAASPQLLGVIDADQETPTSDQSQVTGTGGAAGKAHSVAADPIFNQVYVPIPSNAGSTVCGNAGGNNTLGCIAIYTSTGNDKDD
jgi:hypothetical protein